MTAVFVHGVPETPAIWDGLLPALDRPDTSEDPFLSAASATKAATRAGATTVALDRLGHWWMLQDPAGTATVLREFWATLPVDS